MSWLDKFKPPSIGKKPTPADELLSECKQCKEKITPAELIKNLKVCPHCDYHFRMNARERIGLLTHFGSFTEADLGLTSSDPLKFKDKKKYKDRLRAMEKKNHTHDALVSGTGAVGGYLIELCVFEFAFMGGSMGSVVGEKITRAIERGLKNRHPVVVVSCSGGARMQEGILSLMQMAKTSAALKRLAGQRIPYISILTDPTTGGVSASFAMLGDILIAEPGALIGFAGARVIEQTIQQKLPEGFQTAEFCLDHGLIDQVVHRKELKKCLERVLDLLMPPAKETPEASEPAAAPEASASPTSDSADEPAIEEIDQPS